MIETQEVIVVTVGEYLASVTIYTNDIRSFRVAGTNAEYSKRTLVTFKNGDTMLVEEPYSSFSEKMTKI